jgi:hypothetical protein
MNIMEDWLKVKRVLEVGQASTIYCSIATVNPDGIHILHLSVLYFFAMTRQVTFLIITQKAWVRISI